MQMHYLSLVEVCILLRTILHSMGTSVGISIGSFFAGLAFLRVLTVQIIYDNVCVIRHSILSGASHIIIFSHSHAPIIFYL